MADHFRDISDGPEMTIIPAGRFVMGSPAAENMRDPEGSEDPQHEVTIARPFAIGRFAVTVAEFAAFVDATQHPIPDSMLTGEDDDWRERPGRSFRNPAHPQGPRHPVVGVIWDDAKAYVAWLARRTGLPYRLPSEAEWEYAARAGATTPFWWGSTISPAQANYNGDYAYCDGPTGIYRAATVPVDSFAPNPWGLYQVHGNVWEWCEDCWNASYDGAPADGSPRLSGDPDIRVLRGGSWLNGPWVLRSAKRLGDPRTVRHPSFGFRVARSE